MKLAVTSSYLAVSASYACTSVHIATHKAVLANDAVVAHVQPFNTATVHVTFAASQVISSHS